MDKSPTSDSHKKQPPFSRNHEHMEELPFHPKTGTSFLLKSRVGLNTGDMVKGIARNPKEEETQTESLWQSYDYLHLRLYQNLG